MKQQDVSRSVKREELQKSRLSKGYTRPEFAEILGVSAEHIKSLEYGRVNPSLQLMFKISAELSKSPEDLFPDLVSSAQK